MKERVTLTIEKEVLEQVDSTIDGSLVKNRSHAFELLITKALGNNHVKKAVILAGGKHQAKTKEFMVKVNGKTILQHNLDLLKKHGIKEVILAIPEGSADIKKEFEKGNSGLNISYIEEKDPLGTAGVLRNSKLDETFIAMNADELKEINLKDMFEFHRENNGLATIALTTVRDPSKYGVALLNGNKITTFIEKPSKENAPSNLISAGLYILEPEVLELIPEGYASMEEDLFPKLASQDKLFGYPFSGMWADTTIVPKFKFSIKDISLRTKQ